NLHEVEGQAYVFNAVQKPQTWLAKRYPADSQSDQSGQLRPSTRNTPCDHAYPESDNPNRLTHPAFRRAPAQSTRHRWPVGYPSVPSQQCRAESNTKAFPSWWLPDCVPASATADPKDAHPKPYSARQARHQPHPAENKSEPRQSRRP